MATQTRYVESSSLILENNVHKSVLVVEQPDIAIAYERQNTSSVTSTYRAGIINNVFFFQQQLLYIFYIVVSSCEYYLGNFLISCHAIGKEINTIHLRGFSKSAR
jgi:hypothetical protein